MKKLLTPSILLSLLISAGCGLAPVEDTKSPPLLSAEFLGVQFKSNHPMGNESLTDALVQPSREQILKLQEDARALVAMPGSVVEIVGFTDGHECSGDDCDSLSLRRAKLVYDWFVANGVPKTQLKTPEGLGNRMPISSNSTEEERQRSRRVEVNLRPPGYQ